MKRIMTIFTLTAVIGILFGTARAGGMEAPTVTFALLEKTTFSNTPPPRFPPELSKLEGKRVRISGFVIPYDDPEKLMKMMLIKSPVGCFFCSPPSSNAVVFVRRVLGDPPLKNGADMVDVEGILHLWRAEMKKDDEAKGFFFTIDEARASSKKR